MFNVFLGFFWLCAGAALLFVHFTGRQVMHLREDAAGMLGMLALLLSAYNFVRWWAARASRRARMNEMRRDSRAPRESEAHTEYDPALDFTKPDSPEPPKLP